MFYYIQGIVAHVAPYLAVLDCSGVGYACKTTNHTLAALTRGKSAKLYTHLYVREEIMELYGFINYIGSHFRTFEFSLSCLNGTWKSAIPAVCRIV